MDDPKLRRAVERMHGTVRYLRTEAEGETTRYAYAVWFGGAERTVLAWRERGRTVLSIAPPDRVRG